MSSLNKSTDRPGAHVNTASHGRQAFGVPEEDERDQAHLSSDYVSSISVNDEAPSQPRSHLSSYTAPREFLDERSIAGTEDADPFAATRKKTVGEKESEYLSRHRLRQLSPERTDAFAADASSHHAQSYADVMREQAYEREKKQALDALRQRQQEDGTHDGKDSHDHPPNAFPTLTASTTARKRKWDMPTPVASTSSHFAETPRLHHTASSSSSPPTSTHLTSPKRSRSEWDDDDDHENDDSKQQQHMDDGNHRSDRLSQETNVPKKRSAWEETPQRASRWDDEATPVHPSAAATGSITATPKSSRWDSAPKSLFSTPSMTPTPGLLSSSAMDAAFDPRQMPWTDDVLDRLLPTEGYAILPPPASYRPIRTPARKLMATPMHDTAAFAFPEERAAATYGVPLLPEAEGLPAFKDGDALFFGKLLEASSAAAAEQQKERLIMTLLLKIKNGDPPARKTALRQLVEKARWFGAGALFDQILPILMSGHLEDSERHVLVKVLDRLLFRLDDLVRPFVHKIIVVTSPLLLDANHYVRMEGSEIIANLAKAAGLATMIAALRPDIDHSEELVRNLTAKTLAVVASALGLPALLPFIKAVCRSRKSWQARHTGIKLILFIAQRLGCAVLPHLKPLVDCIQPGITDEQSKVRTVSALGLAALAEAAHPYGIESFDEVLKPLWRGIRQHRGKGLAAFLKAFGSIIPLMDSEFANYYTREVMTIAVREFAAKDAELRRIVLRVVQQCAGTAGVQPLYLRDAVLPDFFQHVWTRESASTPLHRAVIDTAVALALNVGAADILRRLLPSLKDSHLLLRKMTMACVERICQSVPQALSDVDERMEMQLMDALLLAFQGAGDSTALLSPADMEGIGAMLRGFGAVIVTLNTRAKPYLSQIAAMILWRLNHKQPVLRQQASDLMAVMAPVMMQCQEEALLLRMSHVVYEALGEVFPDVLGALLGALKAVVSVVGMTRMVPSVKDLLPRLTPILKNRHERVQEHCIDLVGRIADRGADFVSPREWMRICFELLDLLKAPRKSVRRAAINTFGYIAKAIGPHDVLSTLLNNLKVQERTNRVCTTVAIAIVAETCAPFTVLPALMNEYRVPELNVQNGVLKSLSFLFEYVGEVGRDYVYAVVPLLQDALIDRDLVHRQLACNCIKHMALGAVGLGCEDALLHLLNYVWPNVFETSPHLWQAVLEAIEALRCALGADRVLQYLLQGLFHPARKVRDVYWRLYNVLYYGQQEALVAVYPSVDKYLIPELQYIL